MWKVLNKEVELGEPSCILGMHSKTLTFITHVNINSIAMWVILQNNAGWVCFLTPIFAGDLEDSKSTSGGTLCAFGSHTFAPMSWMCKKQTAVSHSSTESFSVRCKGSGK